VNVFQALVLGIVQGATEFIPVSSSGHLVLVPWLLGWEPPGLAFTIVVHLGTACGLLAFFWREWITMARSTLRWVRTGKNDADARLALMVLIGILPAAIVGLLFRSFFERVFQEPLAAALMLPITALLLLMGERLGRLTYDITQIKWRDSLVIGLAQMLALMPGISRSGATIAAARLRNMKRSDAARFSFLLVTPLVIGVGTVQIIELVSVGVSNGYLLGLIAGFVAAAASSYLVIRWLLGYLRSRSTSVFAIYCLLLSAASLVVLALRA
jgi:undecaprenyl-diphosphatase